MFGRQALQKVQTCSGIEIMIKSDHIEPMGPHTLYRLSRARRVLYGKTSAPECLLHHPDEGEVVIDVQYSNARFFLHLFRPSAALE